MFLCWNATLRAYIDTDPYVSADWLLRTLHSLILESNLKILHLEKQHYCHTRCVYKHNILYYLFPPPAWFSSPPERHHWGRRDRPVLLSSLVQDENFHHLLFSQHHQQVALDESRQYNHTSTASRMLHPPAAHLPQQSPIMVDLHDQVTERK